MNRLEALALKAKYPQLRVFMPLGNRRSRNPVFYDSKTKSRTSMATTNPTPTEVAGMLEGRIAFHFGSEIFDDIDLFISNDWEEL